MIEATVVYESAYRGQRTTKVFKGYIEIFRESQRCVLMFDEDNSKVIEVPYERIYSIQYKMSEGQKWRLSKEKEREKNKD